MIDKLHAKKPADRFQSAPEVADLLRYQFARLQSGEAPSLCPIKRRQRRIQQAIWASVGAASLMACLAIGEATGLTRMFLPRQPAGAVGDEAPSPELRSTLNGNAGPVRSVAFSPNGGKLVMAIDDGTVKVWDVKTGGVLATINCAPGDDLVGRLLARRQATRHRRRRRNCQALGHDDMERTAGGARKCRRSGRVVFPDGKRFVTGGRNGDVVIWDAETGKELTCTAGHPGIVMAVAISRDGKMIASGGGDKTVKLWDAESGQERIALQGHTGAVHTVASRPTPSTSPPGAGTRR